MGNGSVCGSDDRILAYLEGHTVDVGGLDGHRINDIPIAMVGAVMHDQVGFIAIINQVVHTMEMVVPPSPGNFWSTGP